MFLRLAHSVRLHSRWRHLRALLLLSVLLAPNALAQAITPHEVEQRIQGLEWTEMRAADREWLARAVDSLDAVQYFHLFARTKGFLLYADAKDGADRTDVLNRLSELQILSEANNDLNALTGLIAIEAEIYLYYEEIERSLGLIPALHTMMEQASRPRVLYEANHTIARILQREGRLQEALEHLLAAQLQLTQLNTEYTPRHRQSLNIQIARIQLSLSNYTAASILLDNTIDESNRLGLTERLPELWLMRGYAQQYLEGPSDAVVDIFLMAAETAEHEGVQRVHMLGYNNAGAALLHLQRFEEALKYLGRGIEIAEAIGNVNERSVMEFNVGYIEVMRGNHAEGIEKMRAAGDVFRGFASPYQVVIFLGHMAHAYELAGMHQEQAGALKEQLELREVQFTTERDRVFSELQIQYEAQEKSLQIQLLEQESALQQQDIENRKRNQLFTVIVVSLLIAIIALMAFIFTRMRRLNGLLNQANHDLKLQSLQDPLTGLWNRRAVNKRIRTLKSTPKNKANYALFLLDIDHFKQINDKYGHDAGDVVLREVSRRLSQLSHHNDLVARWGGEEFLILIENPNVDGLPALARRILDSVSIDPIRCEGRLIRVTLSGGYLYSQTPVTRNKGLKFDDMLRIVDILLYMSKHQGRNQITGLKSLVIKQTVQEKEAYRELLQSAAADTMVIPGPRKR